MRFHVLREAAGRTLEEFLVHLLGIGPRAALKKAFTTGGVLVNGRAEKRTLRVAEGDVVEIPRSHELGLGSREAASHGVIASPELGLDVVFRSERMVVVNKPGGQNAHPLRGDESDTTLNALAARYPETGALMREGRPLEGGLVHRIDRGTSGLLVCARTPEAWAELKRAWASRAIEKVYLAWVEGKLERRGRIELRLARDPKSKKKMAVVRGDREGWPAVTSLEAVSFDSKALATLVLVRIHTGVTHQIRATLRALGHPVLADPIYKRPSVRAKQGSLEPLDADTTRLFAALRADFPSNSSLELKAISPRAFFLHALWLRIPRDPDLSEGLIAPPPRFFIPPNPRLKR